jgi:hypothetical protein
MLLLGVMVYVYVGRVAAGRGCDFATPVVVRG